MKWVTTIKATALIFALTVAVQGQTARRTSPPPILKLAPNVAGELTATARFSLSLSTPGPQETEFVVKADTGLLHISCSWESPALLLISVTGAAGHGLPGRIGLANRMGQSPIDLEVQVAPQQVGRGPIYINIRHSPLQRGNKGTVHGTLVVSLGGSGMQKADDRDQTNVAQQEGKLLSVSEVKTMEEKLRSDPLDWPTRLSLLSYYSSSADLRMSKSVIVAARRRHILWAIENRSTAPKLFDQTDLQMSNHGPLADPDGAKQAEQAWQRAIAKNPLNNQILLNSALFSATIDPAFSEEVLQRAKSNNVEDLFWNRALGWLYATALVSDIDKAFAQHAQATLISSENTALLTSAALILAKPEQKFSTNPPRAWLSRPKYIDLSEELAARAVSLEPKNPYCLWSMLQVVGIEFETAETTEQKLRAQKKTYSLFQQFDELAVDPGYRTLLLPVLASLAFEVNDDKAAKTYATQALDVAAQRSDIIDGIAVGPQAIHDANDVLGRIALRDGDVQLAKEYLLKAAGTPGGGSMSTVGPRMMLAQALLVRGERDVVLDYLEKIKASWKSGVVQLDHWIAAIRRGKSERLNLVDASIPASPGR
jgi:hypothetical protein